MSDSALSNLTNVGDARPGRRGLLQLGITLAGACYTGAVGYPVYRYLATPARRAEVAEGEITTVSIPVSGLPGPGTATIFLFGSRPTLLIHHEDGHYVASTRCAVTSAAPWHFNRRITEAGRGMTRGTIPGQASLSNEFACPATFTRERSRAV